MQDEALYWARRHYKEVVANFVDKEKRTEGSPVCIFMAGLPGAGKTEISKSISETIGTEYLRVDLDELVEFIPKYTPQKAKELRAGGVKLMEKLLDAIFKKKLDFILDGTFAGSKAVKNLQRAEKHGYGSIIIYVQQDPKLAWRFTKAREQVEKRGIDKEGFLESYEKTIINLRTVLRKEWKYLSCFVIRKNIDNSIKDMTLVKSEAEFDRLTNKIYNKEELRIYIDNEK